MSHVLTTVPDWKTKLPTQAGGRIATQFRNTVIPLFTRGTASRHDKGLVGPEKPPVSQSAIHPEMHPRIFLPPPPPLPPTFLPPVSSTMSADQHPNQLGTGTPYDIKAIEKQYDALRDERQDLMGFRFRLQSIREDIRSIREQTETQDGSVLNQLRQHLAIHGIVVPKAVEELFESIDILRDKLGIREAEYEDAERDYHMQELAYNSRESELFDSIVSVDRLRPSVLGPSSLPMNENVTNNLDSNSTSSWQSIHDEVNGDDRRLSQKTFQPLTDANIHLITLPYVHDSISYRYDRTD